MLRLETCNSNISTEAECSERTALTTVLLSKPHTINGCKLVGAGFA